MMVFLCSDYEGNVQEHKIGCMNVLSGIKRWQSADQWTYMLVKRFSGCVPKGGVLINPKGKIGNHYSWVTWVNGMSDVMMRMRAVIALVIIFAWDFVGLIRPSPTPLSCFDSQGEGDMIVRTSTWPVGIHLTPSMIDEWACLYGHMSRCVLDVFSTISRPNVVASSWS